MLFFCVINNIGYAEFYMYLLFSFFDGVSLFEELVEEVVCFGLEVFVFIDYDGMYGIVCFVEAVEVFGLFIVFGVELSFDVVILWI